MCYVTNNGILSPFQYGFREGVGCSDALVCLRDQIVKFRSVGHVALVSLDIRAAYDGMDWEVLLQGLSSSGFPASFCGFIYSYLTGRKVLASVGFASGSRVLSRGCPQGSVLSPILWSLYINDLLINLPSLFPDTHVQAFADDVVLLVPGRGFRASLERYTNEVLDFVSKRLTAKKLQLSTEKCKIIAFRETSSGKNPDFCRRYQIFRLGSDPIRVVPSLKILGVVFHEKLY